MFASMAMILLFCVAYHQLHESHFKAYFYIFNYRRVMGLLTEGSPLSWEDTKKLKDHVRKHGIQQFINLFARLKDRQGDGNYFVLEK